VSVNNFIGERNSGKRTRTWEHFGTTVPVKDEVLSSIKIKNPVEVVSDLDRPNCYYLASDAREP
jgi:hypothetical protein